MDITNCDILENQVLEKRSCIYRALADRPIFKPQVQNFWPAQTNIEWHRKLVYRKKSVKKGDILHYSSFDPQFSILGMTKENRLWEDKIK